MSARRGVHLPAAALTMSTMPARTASRPSPVPRESAPLWPSLLRVCPGRIGGRSVGWVQPTKCQGLTSVGCTHPTTVKPAFRDSLLLLGRLLIGLESLLHLVDLFR